MKKYFFLTFVAFLSTSSFAQTKSSPHEIFSSALTTARANNLNVFYNLVGEFDYTFQDREGRVTQGRTRMAKELSFEWMDYLSQKMVYGKTLSLGPARNTKASCHYSYWIMENGKQSPVSVEFVCAKFTPSSEPSDCKIIRFKKGRFPAADGIICRQG